jgi:hypothetical protein
VTEDVDRRVRERVTGEASGTDEEKGPLLVFSAGERTLEAFSIAL